MEYRDCLGQGNYSDTIRLTRDTMHLAKLRVHNTSVKLNVICGL